MVPQVAWLSDLGFPAWGLHGLAWIGGFEILRRGEEWKNCSKALLVAAVLCLGLTYTTKADSIAVSGSSSADTFTGVDIFAVTPTLNPFGVTPIICPGLGVACNQGVFGTSSPTFEVVDGYSSIPGGGFSITETTPSGNGNTVSVSSNTALQLLAGYCGSTSSIFTPGAAALTVNPGTECTSAGSFIVNGQQLASRRRHIDQYLGNGTFSVTDNSFEMAFQLTSQLPPSTPEPSSLLMLGSGLFEVGRVGLTT